MADYIPRSEGELVTWLSNNFKRRGATSVQPGVPEQREYAARGLINDHEVGQMSDAVTVVYAG